MINQKLLLHQYFHGRDLLQDLLLHKPKHHGLDITQLINQKLLLHQYFHGKDLLQDLLSHKLKLKINLT